MAEKKKKKKEVQPKDKPGFQESRPKETHRFKTTGKPTKIIGGKEVSPEEYKQKKREAEVEVATGKPFGETPKETQQREIKEVAGRSFAIGEEKERLQTEKEEKIKEEEPTILETIKKTIEPPQDIKGDTETIIYTDEYGIQSERQMPAGTSEALARSKAKREGRVSFSELPEYQQFLVGTAILGASPSTLTAAGKSINLISKGFGKLMSSIIGKYITGTTTFSGIITWLASDNLIGTMSIYGRDLAEDVKWGQISKEEAIEKFDEGVSFVEKGKSFIRTATMINPLLWPFRNIILTNVEAAELSLEENRNRILKGEK